jgi:hypothetical protein
MVARPFQHSDQHSDTNTGREEYRENCLGGEKGHGDLEPTVIGADESTRTVIEFGIRTQTRPVCQRFATPTSGTGPAEVRPGPRSLATAGSRGLPIATYLT